MKTAICPGSFDPVTMGHIDIIERAAALFDKLIVAVMHNSKKMSLFSTTERVEMLLLSLAHIPNTVVMYSDKLLADFIREVNADVAVKGLRAMSDFEQEFQMALINRRLNRQMDTVFLTAAEQHQYLSSSVVKEVARLGGCITGLVPVCVEERVLRKLCNTGGAL
ncbi:MAG: pantetheine-phosphate adenylyltransferase [Oscillospiraceae bacterium]|jgi:pantetheine-phosphate adenylyltransferase|nr:pantetheine-phosphate adenylyltransferase [Oscillospiraceae bacterium]